MRSTLLRCCRLLALAVLFVSLPAGAVIETYEFSEPSLERRYHVLSDELRCPKCQNQTIADSNAPIAKDLRFLLHQQLEDGASDEEILSFMVDRYGEFVRYRPDLDARTAVLWYGPAAVTVLAFLGLLLHLRSRRRPVTGPEPSAAELTALREQIKQLDGQEDSPR